MTLKNAEISWEKVESGGTTSILTVFSLRSIAAISEELEGIKQYREFLKTIDGFEEPYRRSQAECLGA